METDTAREVEVVHSTGQPGFRPARTAICPRPRAFARLFVGSLICLALTGGGSISMAAGWYWHPEVTVAAGHESDLVLDPDFARFVVPGGGFFEVSPRMSLQSRLGRRTSVRLISRSTFDRFFNDQSRRLFASSLTSELLLRMQGPLFARISLGGNYFDDSGRETVRRFSGGLEAAIGTRYRGLRLELLGFTQGRRYPRVQVPDDFAALGDYTESNQGIGGHAAWQPHPLLRLQVRGTRRRTDARDLAFDASTWTLSGDIAAQLTRRTRLIATGVRQERHFSERPAGEDSDSYLQYGLGLDHDLSRSVRLIARYARASYTYPLGGSEETGRLTVGATIRIGRGRGPRHSGNGYDPLWISRSIRAGEPTAFRIHAPTASTVSLVGGFNGWDSTADPLRPVGEGWWECYRALPAGTHEYVLVVDRQTVVPPAARETTDDGFGGRNAVIHVVP